MFYLNHWGMKTPPFTNDLRAETFIITSSAALALAKINYSLANENTVTGLIGEAGVGKTHLIKFINTKLLQENWYTAYMYPPNYSARQLLKAIEPNNSRVFNSDKSAWLEIEAILYKRLLSRRKTLLIVDDVQAMYDIAFIESLRSLLNIEYQGKQALNIILAGQENMERKLAEASNFNQQFSVRVTLEKLTPEEIKLYILTKIKLSGSKHAIFTKQSAEAIIQYSQGIPRQINRICELALITAYGLEEKRITPDIIKIVAIDLRIINKDEEEEYADYDLSGDIMKDNQVKVSKYDNTNNIDNEEDILANI